MRKQWREEYLYYGGILLLCILLAVGLLSLLVKNTVLEKKQAKPSGELTGEKEAAGENGTIRVVIKTNGFQNMEHTDVTLCAESGMILRYGKEIKEYKPKEEAAVTPGDAMFQMGNIIAEPKKPGEKIAVTSLKRGYGMPSYRGKLELYQTKKGITIVNELPLEEYLYAVVPSEMPASYELEALKAQAVCARSYAAKQTRGYSYPEYKAHVDDSTAFQVYGNSKEQERAVRAVSETAGEKVWYGNEIATTYYFSTSCGQTTTSEAWGSSPGGANAYLASVEVGGKEDPYEKGLPWFRWTAHISEELLSRLLAQNTKTELGKLNRVEVTKRGPGNVALQLVAAGEKGTVTVDTENKIRRALGGDGYQIARQDGSVTDSRELLPSAFFTIEKKGTDYIIRGGGFGHGIGMSQNGANEMAKRGKNYKEILGLFYRQIEVRK